MKVVGIVGRSGSGKTHLVERLVAHWSASGLAVSTVKHTHHHDVDLDRQGKDSYRHRAAGAREVILASDRRWALLRETPRGAAPLDTLLARLERVDVVLVEGFRGLESLPRLEVHRAAVEPRPLAAEGGGAAAVASDVPERALRSSLPAGLPILDLDDTAAIAAFLLTLERKSRP